MKTELKTKWVEALRSGKYKQGKGFLNNNNNKYCCLGVLLDISNEGEWCADEYSLNYCFIMNSGEEGSSCSILLSPTVELFDISDKIHSKLTLMNDGGKDFCTIADWIEENI